MALARLSLLKKRKGEKRMRMRSFCAAVGLVAAAALTGCNETENARRTTSLCGDGWRFTKDAGGTLKAAAADFDDAAWQTVEVPHDWAISGPFDPET